MKNFDHITRHFSPGNLIRALLSLTPTWLTSVILRKLKQLLSRWKVNSSYLTGHWAVVFSASSTELKCMACFTYLTKGMNPKQWDMLNQHLHQFVSWFIYQVQIENFKYSNSYKKDYSIFLNVFILVKSREIFTLLK